MKLEELVENSAPWKGRDGKGRARSDNPRLCRVSLTSSYAACGVGGP